MLTDVIIVVFAIATLVRGQEIGFVRQLGSTIGFFGGLFIGVWVQHYTVHLAHTDLTRSMVSIATTLGFATIFLTIGEYVGVRLKHKVLLKRINTIDNWLGSGLALVSFLLSIWLVAAALQSMPLGDLQKPIAESRIVRGLNRLLPDAPTVVADLGQLVNPNGFPQVFIGNEPLPPNNINLPSLGELQSAVKADQDSVVKVVGRGCGGVVEGSGFVVGPDLVATNAHVIAGIRHPRVEDTSDNHSATPVWFDPDLDFAVLRVSELAGAPLKLTDKVMPSGTPAAVIGFPGGGGLQASAAAVLNDFRASGRNIYNQGRIVRDVYEIRSDIIPGNSGGPLVAKDGSVIGVIFAESTAYDHVGYALTMPQVINELHKIPTNGSAVDTGSCAE